MSDFSPSADIFLPGFKPVLELLQSEPQRIEQVFIRKGRRSESDQILDLCRLNGIRFSLLEGIELERLTKHAKNQGVAAKLRESLYLDFGDLLIQAQSAPLPLIIALDQVQDPGNLGALARSLYAMGGGGILLTRHNSAKVGSGARKAAAGALERLPLAECVNLSRALTEASMAGYTVYAAQAGEDSLNALSAPLQLPALLVLGNEDKGLRPGVAQNCDYSLEIPLLRDFDSLNVAQAGGILSSCFLRQQLQS